MKLWTLFSSIAAQNLNWEAAQSSLPRGLKSCTRHRERRYAAGKWRNSIVGGTVASEKAWPWIAPISEDGEFRCTGSIIDDEWILTAGHCCATGNPLQFTVNIGRRSLLYTNEPWSFTVSPKAFYLPDDFGVGLGIHNDVCLLHVPSLDDAKPTACRDCFEHACLADSAPQAGRHCWVAGWGNLAKDKLSLKPRDVALNIMPEKYCENNSRLSETFGEFPVGDDSQFCAGIPDRNGNKLVDGHELACQGDGGSPLVCIDGDSAVVHGLRSWGVDCSDEGQPSVFASVNTQISWIDNVIATAEEAEAAQENDKQKSLEVMPTPAWGFEGGSERIPSKLSEGCSNDVETGFGFARSRFLGIAAKRNTYPWMARLNLCPTVDDCYRCAGTIIADNFILSSASCFQGEFQKISIRVGDHNQKKFEKGEFYVQAHSWTTHPDAINGVNLALIKIDSLKESAPAACDRMNCYKTACLPDQDAHAGQMCHVPGWNNNYDDSSSVLRESAVNVYPSEHCSLTSTYGEDDFNSEQEFCAGNPNWQSGDDSSGRCPGDAGSGLICDNGYGRPVVSGVMSWGEQCDSAGNPSVFSKVAAHTAWIRNKMKTL